MANNEKGISVLVAEDDKDVATAITGLLEETGYTVVGQAPDGMEAVALTQSLRPDVVVMDVRMADMDGIEAARLIYEACPTPVIILTAFDTPELLREASNAGVGMYLVKPTTGPELERAIAIAMARFDDTLELRRLNEELLARNEELDAFAHTVAHDLKNPLHFIINYADLLYEDWSNMPDGEVGRQLELISQNSLRMSNIIDSLLLLAEARMTEVPIEPMDMASVVGEVQQRLSYLIGEHQAELVVPATWPDVVGYPPWVEEVWVNYLSNALQYGGQPPHIELGSEVLSGGMVSFFVQDNGPGIPPEDQERLFRPFTKLDQASTKGHGLGLSIVRSIIEKLGGEVSVESEVGQGSKFTFTLPSAT
jgi:signal transduction histidine kinase